MKALMLLLLLILPIKIDMLVYNINYHQIDTRNLKTKQKIKEKVKSFFNFNFKIYSDSIGYRESRNNYNIISKDKCYGRYQFQEFIVKKYCNVDIFLKNPKVQDSILYVYTKTHLKILEKYNKKSIPDSILLHSCHARGIGNTIKKYKLKLYETNKLKK